MLPCAGHTLHFLKPFKKMPEKLFPATFLKTCQAPCPETETPKDVGLKQNLKVSEQGSQNIYCENRTVPGELFILHLLDFH